MTRMNLTAARIWRPRVALVTTMVALTCLAVRAQGEVKYVYDEVGRLIAVVAPSGEAAVYSYDAVGNLLSITRTPATTVSLVSFHPRTGPTGTSVTVYGTAFSATPSQNTVTINGTAATVTSATTTQLVITVPASATTGPIAVTSPNGSATSSVVFTVTSLPGAPTIAQFSPTIGTTGTAVTIDGSNFQAVLAQNTAVVNVLRFALSSATSSSLSTMVPTGATSGRISVRTPYGSAVSTADFYVPPYAYIASDVVYTSRIPFDSSHTATIG